MRKPVGEIPGDGNARVERPKIIGVGGHHEIRPGRHDRAGGKREIDSFIQLPTSQVHGRRASIKQFNPRDGGRPVGRFARVIQNLVEDDFVMESKVIWIAGSGGRGIEPLSGPIRVSSSERLFHNHGIHQRTAAGRIEKEPVPGLGTETQTCFVQG